MITIEGGRIVPSVKRAPAQDRIQKASTIRRRGRSSNPKPKCRNACQSINTKGAHLLKKSEAMIKTSKCNRIALWGYQRCDQGRWCPTPWSAAVGSSGASIYFDWENIDEIFAKLAITKIDITPKLKVEINALDNVTKGMIVQSKLNIKRAREELVLALHDQWPPRETQSLLAARLAYNK